MKALPALLPILCLLLGSEPVWAKQIVFSCDVMQNVSGLGAHETVTLDTDKKVIGHLKQSWSNGQQSPLVDNLEQFVQIARNRLTWGILDKNTGLVTDLFSLDRKTGAYAWRDENGREIAHGECQVPDLSS